MLTIQTEGGNRKEHVGTQTTVQPDDTVQSQGIDGEIIVYEDMILKRIKVVNDEKIFGDENVFTLLVSWRWKTGARPSSRGHCY